MRGARFLLPLLAVLTLLGLTPGSVVASRAAGATTASAWTPSEDEQWLFELRTDRLRIGDGVRGYADGTRACVNFGDVILALDLPIRIDPDLGRATGWAFDERRTLVIDRGQGRVNVASESRAIAPGAITDTPAGWCVDPATLGDWLGVSITANLSSSVLTIHSPQPLPFELAAQRRARAAAIRPDRNFSLADLPHARQPYRLWQTPSVDVVASTTVIRDVRAQRTTTQARYELYASGELLGASVDARLASDDSALPASLRVRAYRSDPDGRLLGPLRATRVAVGDVSSLSSPIGVQPVAGRGAIVTNRTLDLPDSFDRTTFRGELPAGWDAELYRNGQLIAFASPDSSGRYEFVDVRLMYGLNRFEIVLYGPQGQIRREVHVVPVGIDAIPPGRAFYWASVLDEGRDLIGLRANPGALRRGLRGTFGLEYGLDRRTSLGGWASSMMIDGQRYSMGELAIRRSIGPTIAELSGSLESGGGSAARLLWAGQIGQNYFLLESILARGGYRSDRIDLGVSGLHTLGLDIAPRIAGTILPVHIETRYRTRIDGQNRLEAGARISANWRSVSLTGQLDWGVSSGPLASHQDVTASLLANARIGRLRLRGEAHVAVAGQSANDQVAIVGEWSQSERTDWRAELGYDAGVHRVRAGVGYTRRFAGLALSGVAEAASDGSFAASVGIAMSFGPDPRGHGIRVTRERLASQGQAVATVFYDDNGDGVREADEALAPDVVLTAGNAVAERPTGQDGRAIVDSLAPFRPVLIGIDESSLPSPLVRPALPGVVVVPRPGLATRVLLPLVSAGEVEGVVLHAGGNGIEGADFVLVDGHGVTRATARSDFDGFILFESVPYGTYQLRLTPSSAQALGVDPQLRQVTLDRAHPRIRLGNIPLAARATLARTDPPPTPNGAATGARLFDAKGGANRQRTDAKRAPAFPASRGKAKMTRQIFLL